MRSENPVTTNKQLTKELKGFAKRSISSVN